MGHSKKWIQAFLEVRRAPEKVFLWQIVERRLMRTPLKFYWQLSKCTQKNWQQGQEWNPEFRVAWRPLRKHQLPPLSDLDPQPLGEPMSSLCTPKNIKEKVNFIIPHLQGHPYKVSQIVHCSFSCSFEQPSAVWKKIPQWLQILDAYGGHCQTSFTEEKQFYNMVIIPGEMSSMSKYWMWS